MPLERIFELDDSNEFVMALFDNILSKIAREEGYELNASEAAIVHICMLEADVNNGGFDQYFFNSAGDNGAEAFSGLELIGAKKMAGIVQRAMSVFGDEGPAPEREARQEQMDRWGDAEAAILDALDNEFFKYPDPIADLVMKYCLIHKQDFSE